MHLPFLKKETPTQGPSISGNNVGFAISAPIEIQHSPYNTNQDEYAELDLETTIDNEREHDVVNNASETADYAYNHFVLEKQECEQYDQIKYRIQTSDTKTFNPYNKLRLEENLDYDHVGNGKTHREVYSRKIPNSGNMYNTTHGKLRTSTDAPNNTYDMTDDTDDSYNHINVTSDKTGRKTTENEYNV